MEEDNGEGAEEEEYEEEEEEEEEEEVEAASDASVRSKASRVRMNGCESRSSTEGLSAGLSARHARMKEEQ